MEEFRCAHTGLNNTLELHGLPRERVKWRDIYIYEYENTEKLRGIVEKYGGGGIASWFNLSKLFDATPRRVRMWWPVKMVFRRLFRRAKKMVK